jgi:predicted dienelactone hydrolase
MNALLYVGQQLASHGYAVAALNFPFTSATAIKAAIEGTGAVPPPNAWYGQPGSVSQLIDQVEQRWGLRVNIQAVGVLGQSQGGYTATALAGAELDWDYLVKGCSALNDPSKVVLNPAVVLAVRAPGQVVKQRKPGFSQGDRGPGAVRVWHQRRVRAAGVAAVDPLHLD